jgi:hypothetical protein
VIVPGPPSLGTIADAELDEKIARDIVTLRNVIDVRTLEEQANETTNVLSGSLPGSTQAENDRIRAPCNATSTIAPFFSDLVHSAYETVFRRSPPEELCWPTYAVTIFREGIVLVTLSRSPRARAKLNEAEPLWGIPPNLSRPCTRTSPTPPMSGCLGGVDYYEAQLPDGSPRTCRGARDRMAP